MTEKKNGGNVVHVQTLLLYQQYICKVQCQTIWIYLPLFTASVFSFLFPIDFSEKEIKQFNILYSQSRGTNSDIPTKLQSPNRCQLLLVQSCIEINTKYIKLIKYAEHDRKYCRLTDKSLPTPIIYLTGKAKSWIYFYFLYLVG